MDFNKTIELLKEAATTWKKGSELSPEAQKDAKAKFVHRYTGNNKPAWSQEIWKDGQKYPLHFKDDKDWLENTEFAVKKSGDLCGRTKYCNSKPTYPNHPELRKGKDSEVKESMRICEASDYFIKDALDKVVTGDTPSERELSALLKAGLIDVKGKPTQKAKEEYSELFESLNEDFHVYDNGGKTADRYTIIHSDDFTNRDSKGMVDMLGMDENPTSPQGFSQFTTGQVGKHLGKKIDFNSLPDKLQKHIYSRYED